MNLEKRTVGLLPPALDAGGPIQFDQFLTEDLPQGGAIGVAHFDEAPLMMFWIASSSMDIDIATGSLSSGGMM